MGAKAKKRLRVILDTNVLVSALLFRGGLSALVTLWKNGAFVPLFSKETFAEFRSVLSYPKFKLTKNEIDGIIHEEVLPYVEVVVDDQQIRGICPDPHDDKFVSCAMAAQADFIVTGDQPFYALGKFKSIKILSPATFLKLFTK